MKAFTVALGSQGFSANESFKKFSVVRLGMTGKLSEVRMVCSHSKPPSDLNVPMA